jgi:xylulose-5-phosphate/fructose-6-phosphate phosphoketolase
LAEVQALEHQETRTMNTDTLTPDLLHRMNAHWRAANYLSVGQIYLYDNPLLKEPLKLSRVKTAPGRTPD